MAFAWTPRSQRMGKRDYEGPYEGVPPHMVGPLMDWLEQAFQDRGYWRADVMRMLALRLNVPIPIGANDYQVFASIKSAALADQEVFLDFVEGALQVYEYDPEPASELRAILTAAGSVLTLSTENPPILVDVVGEEAQKTYEVATAMYDEVSDELRVAWSEAYGRNPNPSDAWDHAIKAVEAALRPVVQPNNKGATLGAIIGAMSSAGAAQWEFVLPGKDLDNEVTKFVETLRLMWPNPDRHGGGGGRAPSLEEARAVVNLAAMVVQWHREAWVVRKR